MSNLVATFSASATGAMIAVTAGADSWDAIATARPCLSDDPIKALAALGYKLAHPTQAPYSLRSTMADTGYAKLAVVPAR